MTNLEAGGSEECPARMQVLLSQTISLTSSQACQYLHQYLLCAAHVPFVKVFLPSPKQLCGIFELSLLELHTF